MPLPTWCSSIAKSIADRSTFSDPAALPSGIEKVFVGGELVWDRGQADGRPRPAACLMSGRTRGVPIAAVSARARLGTAAARHVVGRSARDDDRRARKLFAFIAASRPWSSSMPYGRVLKMWGEKMFVWPHGLRVDRDGFLWITDGRARGGIGQQVFKFAPDGRLVMTLGKNGVAGDSPRHVQQPDRRGGRRRTATSSSPTATSTRAS